MGKTFDIEKYNLVFWLFYKGGAFYGRRGAV